MKYFDIHVIEDFKHNLGYSVILETEKNLSVENSREIIKEAINEELIDNEDARYIDYISEIDKEDYVLETINLR